MDRMDFHSLTCESSQPFDATCPYGNYGEKFPALVKCHKKLNQRLLCNAFYMYQKNKKRTIVPKKKKENNLKVAILKKIKIKINDMKNLKNFYSNFL